MRDATEVNQYRRRAPGTAFDSDDSFGMHGCFAIRIDDKHIAECVVSGGLPEKKDEGEEFQWEHVSVKLRYQMSNGKWRLRCPNWQEMCVVKNTFWRPDEAVIQVHPPESEYVNCHPNTLHLWRPLDGQLRLPPKICV